MKPHTRPGAKDGDGDSVRSSRSARLNAPSLQRTVANEARRSSRLNGTKAARDALTAAVEPLFVNETQCSKRGKEHPPLGTVYTRHGAVLGSAVDAVCRPLTHVFKKQQLEEEWLKPSDPHFCKTTEEEQKSQILWLTAVGKGEGEDDSLTPTRKRHAAAAPVSSLPPTEELKRLHHD
uniref:Uncharacterized protein n=1 Tax=Knipowitschia caucasica TaxID=637954 RepID=A0AAV2LA20_KNICA